MKLLLDEYKLGTHTQAIQAMYTHTIKPSIQSYGNIKEMQGNTSKLYNMNAMKD